MTEPSSTITKYLSGALDQREVEQFQRWLQDDPANLRAFVREAAIDRGIHEFFSRSDSSTLKFPGESAHVTERDAEHLIPGTAKHPKVSSTSIWPWGSWPRNLAVAASILFAISLVPWNSSESARLDGEVAAVWQDNGQESPTHFEVRRDYMLESGLVLLSFPTGAKTVIQGPAEFQIVDENAMRLQSGKVVALCQTKATHLFTVHTPFGRVVDLGTEFGVWARATEKNTSTYVFDGEVQLFATQELSGTSRIIREGQAAELNQTDIKQVIADGLAQSFCTVEEFHQQSATPQ